MLKLINRIVHFFLVLFGKRVYPVRSLLQQKDSLYYYILVGYREGRAVVVDEFDTTNLLKLEDLKNNFNVVKSIHFNNADLEVLEVGTCTILCEGQCNFTLTELNEGV